MHPRQLLNDLSGENVPYVGMKAVITFTTREVNFTIIEVSEDFKTIKLKKDNAKTNKTKIYTAELNIHNKWLLIEPILKIKLKIKLGCN